MGKFFVFIGLLISTFGFACKCNYQSFGENFAQNDFVAEIEIIRVYNVSSTTDEDDRFYKADIKILKLYKGKSIQSILVRGKVGQIYGSACEVDVKKGEKFLIYLNPEENFGMSSCTPTFGLDNPNINKERKALDFLISNKLTNTNSYYLSEESFEKFKTLKPQNHFAVYKLKIDSKSKAEAVFSIQDFGFGTKEDLEIKNIIQHKFVLLKDFMTEMKNEEIILVLFFNESKEDVISNFNYK